MKKIAVLMAAVLAVATTLTAGLTDYQGRYKKHRQKTHVTSILLISRLKKSGTIVTSTGTQKLMHQIQDSGYQY